VQALVSMLKARYGPFSTRSVREDAGRVMEDPVQETFAWTGS
jgi:hypothetical protein